VGFGVRLPVVDDRGDLGGEIKIALSPATARAGGDEIAAVGGVVGFGFLAQDLLLRGGELELEGEGLDLGELAPDGVAVPRRAGRRQAALDFLFVLVRPGGAAALFLFDERADGTPPAAGTGRALNLFLRRRII
jgi:hypothetical protein